MSDNEDIVVLDEEQPEDKPPAPTPKPKEEPVIIATAKDVVKAAGKHGKAFFDRFGGKAPQYKLAGTFHIHDITAEEADNCRKFDTWAKPKRLGLTTEFAEKMRKLGKLVRYELPFDD